MADTKDGIKPKCVIMIAQEYPMGGFGFAWSTDGTVPDGAAMTATTHLWEGTNKMHRAMEDTFKQSVYPPQLPAPSYQRLPENYQPPNPPRMAQPGDETLEEIPRFMTSHPGHASGLVEQVKKMAANGGRASAFLFCAGIAFAAFVQRAGLV